MPPLPTNISLNSDAGRISEKIIKSFAVLDLETSNLPCNDYNRVAITELSIYGIAADEFDAYGAEEEKVAEKGEEESVDAEEASYPKPPALPRKLHKLTLMLNPRRMVHPEAEKVTGLNNYMLEHETHFDENAANTILGFLKHLQQPVCLVAHNGWQFDFPIVKRSFKKIGMALPAEMMFIDSYKAFFEIDERRKRFPPPSPEPLLELEDEVIEIKDSEDLLLEAEVIEILDSPLKLLQTTKIDVETKTLRDHLEESTLIDRRRLNESTPKRVAQQVVAEFNRIGAKRAKRKLYTELDCRAPSSSSPRRSHRSLFPESKCQHVIRNQFPNKNTYRLGHMFQRIFNLEHTAHRAEEDVKMLTQLMLHYGNDFVDYANQFAKPFRQIQNVGEAKLWSSPE